MRTYVVACFVLAGCLRPADDFADLTVTWQRQHVDKTPAACPAGFESMFVRVHNKQSFFSDEGFFSDTFPCAANTGTLHLQTSGQLDDFGNSKVDGVYDQITVQLTNAGGESILEEALALPEIDLSHGNQTLPVTIVDDGGYEVVNWNYRSTLVPDNKIGCESAAVDGIELRMTDADGHAFVDKFPCAGTPGLEATEFGTAFAGMSAAVRAGDYTGVLVARRAGADLADSGMFTFKVEPHNKPNLAFPEQLFITIPDR
jgi:hypothetical protein